MMSSRLAASGLRAALASLTLACLLATGCGGDDKPASATPSATKGSSAAPAASPGAVPPVRANPPGSAGRPAFESAEACGKCHTAIYAEWKASWHGEAMVDPHFLRLSDGLQQEECIRCHAPVPLREMENWETPIARSERREDAVSCLTCHQSGGSVAGPFECSGACRPVKDDAQRDVTKVCFACHNQHKTGEEWLAGPYAPDAPSPRTVEAKDCLDCHMPWVERPLVAGGPVRRGRKHVWPGGHEMSQLQRAGKLEVETTSQGDGTRIRTWFTNVGAGHNVPTDARHRSFDVYVKVWDEEGRVVLDPLDPDPTKQARTQTAQYRLQYRNSSLPDTQASPKVRVSGLGKWKGYVDVPGVTRGRGEVWLVYRLTPEDALVPESLTDPVVVLYRARRVTSLDFTFGG